MLTDFLLFHKTHVVQNGRIHRFQFTNEIQVNWMVLMSSASLYSTSFQTTTTKMITTTKKMTPITGTLISINLFVCQIYLFRLSKSRVYTLQKFCEDVWVIKISKFSWYQNLKPVLSKDIAHQRKMTMITEY